MIGQGANTALEDAVVLVKCTERMLKSGNRPSKDQIAEAFNLFVRVRQPRLDALRKVARSVTAQQYNLTPLSTFIRNKVLSWLPKSALLEGYRFTTLYDCRRAMDELLAGVTPDTCGRPLAVQKKIHTSPLKIVVVVGVVVLAIAVAYVKMIK